MKTKSINLSGKIDSFTIGLYEAVVRTAAGLGVKLIVVGAKAREMVLEKNYNLRPHRATYDFDLGFELGGWEQFENLKGALEQTGHFSLTRETQRMIYRDECPIDIVPFGEIGAPDATIKWPPDHDTLLSIAGFEEAYMSSVEVILRDAPPLSIRVASLPGQIILKLLSWKGRGMETDKDAKDIGVIMRYYGDPCNEDRLYGEEADLMELEGYNIDHAGVRLLGRDVAAISAPELRRTLLELLNGETNEYSAHKLITDMMNINLSKNFERFHLYLEKLKAGMLDIDDGD